MLDTVTIQCQAPEGPRMRISDLAETTGVPVHTLKYYLREGLLMPGEATSRTRAEKPSICTSTKRS